LAGFAVLYGNPLIRLDFFMHPADHWKTLITLAPGQQLKKGAHKTSGFMGEEDIDTYAVVSSDGVNVGEVVVRDHTAVKGFRRSIRVMQTGAAGEQLLNTAYEVGPPG
jgi:hypothetical protein